MSNQNVGFGKTRDPMTDPWKQNVLFPNGLNWVQH